MAFRPLTNESQSSQGGFRPLQAPVDLAPQGGGTFLTETMNRNPFEVIGSSLLEQEAKAPEERTLRENLTQGFLQSEIGLGKSIAGAVFRFTPEAKALDEANVRAQETLNNVIKLIKQKQSRGEDVSRLMQVLQEMDVNPTQIADLTPGIDTSGKKLAGQALGVALDILSFGTYGAGGKVAQTAKTAGQAFLQGAARGALRAGTFGAGFGLAYALQDDEDLGGLVQRTLTGAATSAVIGGTIQGLSERAQFLRPIKAEKLREQAIAQYKKGLAATKEKYKERADKIVPELLDKKIWGKRKDLITKAEKGIALSGKEYEKLGELKGLIETEGLIQKIDDEIARYTLPSGRISSVNTQRVDALQNLRLDITALNVWEEGWRNPIATQQSLRLLAADYGKELYDTRKAMKTITDNKTLSQVKKLDAEIRKLLSFRNPDYDSINKVYHLHSELFDILMETSQRQSGQSAIPLINAVLGTGGAIAGAVTGQGSVGKIIGTVLGGITLSSLATLVNSTWWNTMRAVQKAQIAERLMSTPPQLIPQVVIQMVGQLPKFNRLFNQNE